MITKEKMEPADVYMAVKVSQVADKSLNQVVKTFKKSKGKGWGAVAKKMGIKPGSKEFHALKEDSSGMLNKKSKKHKETKSKGKGKGKGKQK